MSRSGYHDDFEDPLELGRWRAQVRSATRGKRGQALLKEALAALDAMPEKRLVPYELEVSSTADAKHAEAWAKIWGNDVSVPEYVERIVKRPKGAREGDVCMLGAVGKARGLNMVDLDPEDHEAIANTFDVAGPLAREIVYMNDECGPYNETPEQRWTRMRAWVASQIVATATETAK